MGQDEPAPEQQASVASDLVVVLPGIMGSTLARNGKAVWSPTAGAVLRGIRTLGRSIRELTLPADIGDDDPGDGVVATGLMPDLHVVPGLWTANLGYGELVQRLGRLLDDADPAVPRLLPFAYDWRLSNRLNARRLKAVVEPALDRLRARDGAFADARVTFVCHSMGGLIARRYVECEGGREVTRRLVTIGTPHRGALNALEQLVNGVRKGLGPFAVDLSAFSRSLPSAYQLLPAYACVEAAGSARLGRVADASLPSSVDAALVADAAAFHAELDAAAADSTLDLRCVVGTRQPTFTTARFEGERLTAIETIEGDDERGDATVPRLSATPRSMAPDGPAIHWVAAKHGALQSDHAVLDQVEGILTAAPAVIHELTAAAQLAVRAPDLVVAGEEIAVEARVDGDAQPALRLTVADEQGRRLSELPLEPSPDGGPQRTAVRLPAGGYALTVGGLGPAAAIVAPVTSPLVVWDDGGV